MYARVQTTPTVPDHVNTPEASGYFIKVLEGHPGFRGVHLMLQIGSRRGFSVSLWDSREDAEAASGRTQEVMGPRPFTLDFDGVYEVLAGHAGLATVAEASVAQVLWFDGPRSAAQVDAMRRAGEERIQPAVDQVSGHAGTYVLCHTEDSAVVVIVLATSTDALNRIAEAALSTSLLPGEDPALLTGADRIELYTHEAYSVAGVRGA
jgi:hypothetical protein